MKDSLNQREFPLLNYKNYLHYSHFIKWILWSCPHNSVKGVRTWCVWYMHSFSTDSQWLYSCFIGIFSQDTEVLASLVLLSLCGQMKFSPFALLGHTEGLQSNTISSKVLQTNFFITEIVASQSSTKDWKVSETFKKPKPLPAENRSAGIFQTTFTLSCNSPCMCGFHYNRD